MNEHAFYNLLESRIIFYKMKNGVHTYPDEYIERYNNSVARLEYLASEVKAQIAIHTALEKEKMKYTTKGAKQ